MSEKGIIRKQGTVIHTTIQMKSTVERVVAMKLKTELCVFSHLYSYAFSELLKVRPYGAMNLIENGPG